MTGTSASRVEIRRYRDTDEPALIAFLCASPWPYHGTVRVDEAKARDWIAKGMFRAPDNAAHWIECAGERCGLLNVREIEDLTPEFDLRVAAAWRGRGIGRHAVRWLAAYVFDTLDKTRVGGYTRADNVAMRRVFEACGWQQEACHRESWPGADGTLHDCVGYGLLRREWS